jgi:hypothetical protein
LLQEVDARHRHSNDEGSAEDRNAKADTCLDQAGRSWHAPSRLFHHHLFDFASELSKMGGEALVKLTLLFSRHTTTSSSLPISPMNLPSSHLPWSTGQPSD